MADTPTGKERKIRFNCTMCGHFFWQRHGFVTLSCCMRCLCRLADEFWALFD